MSCGGKEKGKGYVAVGGAEELLPLEGRWTGGPKTRGSGGLRSELEGLWLLSSSPHCPLYERPESLTRSQPASCPPPPRAGRAA